MKAHHKNQNIREKSCGKQECSLHEICYMFLLRNWFVTQNNPILQFNPVSSSATSIYNVSSLREHLAFPDVTTSYPAKWSPISASDWSCRDGNLLQSIVGTTQIEIVNQLPPQALRFSHCRGERETRVTWWWTARDDGKGRSLSPSRLPLRSHFYRERDVWVRAR